MYNPQSLNRYSYVLNNPIRYTDPTGHCYAVGGNSVWIPDDNDGPCNWLKNDTQKPQGDITLNGIPDAITITFTADELRDIASNINQDVNSENGIRNNADHNALIANRINGIGNAIVGTIVAGLFCGPTLGTCVFIIGGVFYAETEAFNTISTTIASSSYKDLVETYLYFDNVANQIDPNYNNGNTSISINAYTTLDGGVHIQADGIEGNVSVSGGVYHYNYVIVPYIQP